MRSLTSIIIFVGIMLSVLGTIHYYLWRRLVADVNWAHPWRMVFTALIWTALVAFVGSFMLRRSLPPEVQTPLVVGAQSWLGFMFLFLIIAVVVDVVRLGALGASSTPFDAERRLMFSRMGAMVIGGVGLTAGVFSVRHALRALGVKKINVTLEKWPVAMRGFTIVQVSDIHVGPTIGRAFVEEMVRKINELKPDVIAITGDLVDGSVDHLRNDVEPLSRLQSRFGTFFIAGNHEYYSGHAEWMAHLRTLGIRTLQNERVTLGEGAESFDLAGLDDPTGKPDMAPIVAGRETHRELIVLAHQPRSIKMVADGHGAGLQLSGHTHAGQIWPFSLMVYLQQPFLVGLHKHENTQIYVSPGTGYWGPPMRLGTTAEITHITVS